MGKKETTITYSASAKIEKIHDRLEELITSQAVHVSETRGEIKNVSDRVENLNEKFERAIIDISTLVKANTERIDMYEKHVNEKISKHDNDITEAKATMRTLRHVVAWVGAVISLMAGLITWSIDNFIKNKVEEFSTKEIETKIQEKVNTKFDDLLTKYNIQIQYEK